MKLNLVRARLAAFAVPVAALALGLAAQGCGGAPDTQSSTEQTATSAQDLSILGITIPQPTLSLGLGLGDASASVKIDPIGTIDELIPEQGVKLPDPVKPIDTILGDISEGASASVSVGDISVGLKLPGIELPTIPDPFDGGIELIGK